MSRRAAPARSVAAALAAHPSLASFRAAAAAALLLLPAALAAQERHVLAGASAAIWNLAGEVRLEPGTGADVVVEVTRGGSDARQLEVIIKGGQLVVRYPDSDVVYRDRDRDGRTSTTLRVRDDGTFGDGWRNGDGRRTTVRSYGDGLEAHADLVVKVPAGRAVEVNLAAGRIEATNVQGDLTLDVHAASVTATGTRGRLDIDAGSGSVSVERAVGDVSIDNGSGSAELTGVQGSRVSVNTGSGSVEVRDITTERLTIDVGSGGVRAEGIAADDLRIESGSGSVRVDLTKVPGRSDIDTGSGGVTLALPATANADLDIETGSGGISTDFPVTMNGFSRRELRGKIGQGGSLVRVSTGSGGVRLIKR